VLVVILCVYGGSKKEVQGEGDTSNSVGTCVATTPLLFYCVSILLRGVFLVYCNEAGGIGDDTCEETKKYDRYGYIRNENNLSLYCGSHRSHCAAGRPLETRGKHAGGKRPVLRGTRPQHG